MRPRCLHPVSRYTPTRGDRTLYSILARPPFRFSSFTAGFRINFHDAHNFRTKSWGLWKVFALWKFSDFSIIRYLMCGGWREKKTFLYCVRVVNGAPLHRKFDDSHNDMRIYTTAAAMYEFFFSLPLPAYLFICLFIFCRPRCSRNIAV